MGDEAVAQDHILTYAQAWRRPEEREDARAPPLGPGARGPQGASHEANESCPEGLPAWRRSVGA